MLKWLWKQRMRFQQGQSLISIMNTILLVIAASDKIQRHVEISTALLVGMIVGGGLFGIWFAGWVMTCPSMREAEYEAQKELVPYIAEITARRKEEPTP